MRRNCAPRAREGVSVCGLGSHMHGSMPLLAHVEHPVFDSMLLILIFFCMCTVFRGLYGIM